jgi:hypothetical protein
VFVASLLGSAVYLVDQLVVSNNLVYFFEVSGKVFREKSKNIRHPEKRGNDLGELD